MKKLRAADREKRRSRARHWRPTTRKWSSKSPKLWLGHSISVMFQRLGLINSEINASILILDFKMIWFKPMKRDEVKKNINSRMRFEEDRNRTINDYYRMNLDQTVDSETMTRAYNAYLQNTPGSKKALAELLNQNNNNNKESDTDANLTGKSSDNDNDNSNNENMTPPRREVAAAN